MSADQRRLPQFLLPNLGRLGSGMSIAVTRTAAAELRSGISHASSPPSPSRPRVRVCSGSSAPDQFIYCRGLGPPDRNHGYLPTSRDGPRVKSNAPGPEQDPRRSPTQAGGEPGAASSIRIGIRNRELRRSRRHLPKPEPWNQANPSPGKRKVSEGPSIRRRLGGKSPFTEPIRVLPEFRPRHRTCAKPAE